MTYTYKTKPHKSHGVITQILSTRGRVVKEVRTANQELAETAGRFHVAQFEQAALHYQAPLKSWKQQNDESKRRPTR
ncbi:hypothetical protein LB443_04745 [Pasteurella multocida subsp. multocida]|uniref:hypothetical protein n=1 Tax=Pasteurella multocida TaxID=747 RepID=UPI001F4C6BBC|nr:hypothetical protein [Pasteurella multocida]MDV6009582.1 hypothetical protein [Pasteurella multocida subsp. multocida]